ncbi:MULTISPECIES: hypothetical protein [Cyanophyceae]|nr:MULTISPECIES: hypothetical protein [Cyanophyceae]
MSQGFKNICAQVGKRSPFLTTEQTIQVEILFVRQAGISSD